MKPPPSNPVNLQTERGGPSEALLLAAQAWSAAERARQLEVVLNSAVREPPRFLLVEQRQEEKLQGVVLAECLPGHSAVVMTPQLIAPRERDEVLAGDLLATMEMTLHEHHVLLAQALTPGRNHGAALRFQAAGYQFASDLLYLMAPCSALEEELSLANDLPFELVSHDPRDSQRWGAIIERTYTETLDCPAVDGIRPLRDVLKGYRDIGKPRSDWWFLVRCEGQDIGCLLLADHGEMPQAELVYLGLAPEHRGHGWGGLLVREAIALAQRGGMQQILSSVDADNAPALRHYLAAGFRIWEQRVIWIKNLGSDKLMVAPDA
jgi:ribosomal protein S18 acetylase RimI-like enzyme